MHYRVSYVFTVSNNIDDQLNNRQTFGISLCDGNSFLTLQDIIVENRDDSKIEHKGQSSRKKRIISEYT